MRSDRRKGPKTASRTAVPIREPRATRTFPFMPTPLSRGGGPWRAARPCLRPRNTTLEMTVKTLRLEVRQRTLLLDVRDYVFHTEDGSEVERTDTEGVVNHVEAWVRRRLRGSARVHGRAQLLQALRQFNSPKEGLTQFVLVEEAAASRLVGLVGSTRQA